MITWKDVINFSVKGNPAPDRRVEKTEAEWRELLTPEQFYITRKKGTERLIPVLYAVLTKQASIIVFVVTLPFSILPSSLNRVQAGQVSLSQLKRMRSNMKKIVHSV